MPFRQVPLFPLPRCVLLPSALLPLHVFEPRYRAMADYLVNQLPDERHIAISLLQDGYEDTYHTLEAPIHKTVTVGQVVEHARLDDGRYNLLVHGLWRGQIVNEDHCRGFRMASITRWPEDPEPGQVNSEQLADLEGILQVAIRRGMVDRDVVSAIVSASRQGNELVDLLAFNMLSGDQSAVKQQLLEQRDVHQRCCLLIETLQAQLTNGPGTASPPGPDLSEGWSPTALN